jgi:hypothetical protein
MISILNSCRQWKSASFHLSSSCAKMKMFSHKIKRIEKRQRNLQIFQISSVKPRKSTEIRADGLPSCSFNKLLVKNLSRCVLMRVFALQIFIFLSPTFFFSSTHPEGVKARFTLLLAFKMELISKLNKIGLRLFHWKMFGEKIWRLN